MSQFDIRTRLFAAPSTACNCAFPRFEAITRPSAPSSPCSRAAIPSALYRRLGGLDEQYAIGMFEDDDLAMAVRQSAHRVMLARDIFVHHYRGAAFSKFPQSSTAYRGGKTATVS